MIRKKRRLPSFNDCDDIVVQRKKQKIPGLEPQKKKKRRIPEAKPLVRKKSEIDRLLDGGDFDMDEDVEEKNIGNNVHNKRQILLGFPP